MEKLKVESNDEVDLVELIVIFLKFRFFILINILILSILLVLGFFFIPEWIYSKQNNLTYTKAKMSVSLQPFVAQYMKENDEFLYSNNQSDLIVNNHLFRLMKDNSFLLKNIQDSGNMDILLEDNSFSDYPTIVDNHIVNLSSNRRKNISIDNSDWIFQVEKKTYSIEITVFFRALDMKQANLFLLVLLDNANESIMGFIKPYAIDRVSNYKDYFEIDSFDSIADDVLYDYVSALGIIRGEIDSILVVEGPVIEIIGNSISDYQQSYVRKSLNIFIVYFLLLIILIFLIEFIQNIKNDEKQYVKIKNALEKK